MHLPLTEIHLTRDLVFHAEPRSEADKSQMEWMAVNQALRVMEWGKPPYAREFQDYANHSPSAPSSGRRRNVGLVRGSRLSKWVVYDKIQQLEDKGKPVPPMEGRPVRVEWRVQRVAQIEKRLQVRNLHDYILKLDCESNFQSPQIRSYIEISNEDEFAYLAAAMDSDRDLKHPRSLYADFDVAFVQTFFASEKAYGSRRPVLSPIFVEAVAQYFVSYIARACMGRLRTGEPITRPDADILMVVLNGIGGALTRSILRSAFGLHAAEEERLEDSEKKRRRREYDSCITMLFRLRAGAQYNARDTWCALHHWMLWRWEAYHFVEEGGFCDSSRCDSEMIPGPEFRVLAAPLLEQLANSPHEEDAENWAGNCVGNLSAGDRTCDFPSDLLSIYQQMRDIEQVTVKNSRMRYADEQKAVILRARELEILPFFPQTKKRAARLKTPRSAGA